MFNEFPDQKIINHLRSLYPTGTRVVLEKMDDPYSRLKPGDSGKVIHIDDAGGIHIQWDNGSSLAAIFGGHNSKTIEHGVASSISAFCLMYQDMLLSFYTNRRA